MKLVYTLTGNTRIATLVTQTDQSLNSIQMTGDDDYANSRLDVCGVSFRFHVGSHRFCCGPKRRGCGFSGTKLAEQEGSYSLAWTNAAAYLKANVGQTAFSQQLEGVRKPLGKLVSRKLISTKQLTTVPGGPDGKYVVLQYNTSFTQKKSAVETITPMLDKDGKWRVSGYFIR
jgi:hypothetical protein